MGKFHGNYNITMHHTFAIPAWYPGHNARRVKMWLLVPEYIKLLPAFLQLRFDGECFGVRKVSFVKWPAAFPLIWEAFVPRILQNVGRIICTYFQICFICLDFGKLWKYIVTEYCYNKKKQIHVHWIDLFYLNYSIIKFYFKQLTLRYQLN